MNNKIYFLLSVMIGYYFSVSALVDGDLDPTFGTGGIVTISTASISSGGTGKAVAVQQDGKIVVYTSNESLASAALVRLTTTGAIDTTFNASGPIPGVVRLAVTISLEGGRGMALDAQDNIVVVGILNGPNNFLTVARYIGTGALAGTLDTTFNAGGGTPGVLTTAVASFVVADCAIDSQGRIIIIASENPIGTSFYVVRVLSNGTLDGTFGAGGVVTVSSGGAYQLYPAAVKISADDTIIVSATGWATGSDQDFLIYKLSSTNGSLVAPFNPLVSQPAAPPARFINGNEIPYTGITTGKGLVIGSNSSLYLYGAATFLGPQINAFALYQSYISMLSFTSAGALNTSFGYQGQDLKALIPINNLLPSFSTTGEFSEAYITPYTGRLVQLADGKFIAVGFDAQNIGFVIRLTANGAFDSTFSGSNTLLPGAVATTITSTDSPIFWVDAVVQNNGYIVVVGGKSNAFSTFGQSNNLMLARYVNTIGTPTPTPTPTIEEQLNQNSGALSCAIIQKYATAAVAATYSCNPMAPAPNSNCSK